MAQYYRLPVTVLDHDLRKKYLETFIIYVTKDQLRKVSKSSGWVKLHVKATRM